MTPLWSYGKGKAEIGSYHFITKTSSNLIFLIFPSALIKLNHSTQTSVVEKTKESAGLCVSKLGAAGIAQILLVVVNISVAHKSVASEARLNISHRRRDLLSTCFLVFFIPLYLKSLL